ncbi:glycoside hydrolase family 16 protein [Hymenobacter sp. HD11105]
MKFKCVVIAFGALFFFVFGSSQAQGFLMMPDTSQPDNKWRLVFADEFDNAVHTTASWSFSHYPNRRANNKHECYDTRPLGVNQALRLVVEEGRSMMRITAQKSPHSFECDDVLRTYTSGMLRLKYDSIRDGNTGGEPFTIRRGLIEVRCRLPRYTKTPTYPAGFAAAYGGSTAALWLYNYDMECDVFEGNDGATPFSITYHNWNSPSAPAHQWWTASHQYQTLYPGPPPLEEPFHTYSLVWSEDQISWFLDGRELATLHGTDHASIPRLIEEGVTTYFGRAAQVLLTLEVSEATFEQADFDIDYVRIYKPSDGTYNQIKTAPTGIRPEVKLIPVAGQD